MRADMAILIFLGIPILFWVAIMILSLPTVVSPPDEKPGVLWDIYPDGPPQFQLDYSGKLWVAKKQKSYFRPLRRPGIPPDEPA
jgi:hypothetical protein